MTPVRTTRNSKTNGADLNILRADALADVSWLVHGFSTRRGGASQAYGGGALNLGFTKHDTRHAVERNRATFLTAMGAANGRGQAWPLVTLRQIHSDAIHVVQHPPERALTGDGLVTDRPGLLLAVQTADCLPVLLVDPRRKAVGVFHAGWRGTLARTVEKGVGTMRIRFGSLPRDLRAAIGPGIGPCCYEVGEEVRGQFESQFAYAAELFHEVVASDPVREKYPLLFLTARPPGHSDLRKLHLDLRQANRRQLLDAGLRASNISELPLCTACRSAIFFSHRAEQGHTGRQMGAIGIRP